MKRNYLVTLILSQGVPMLCAGDELGKTQQGNNNAYCQDNALSWIDWNLSESGKELHEFLKELNRFFHDHPSFRRQHFFEKTMVGNKTGLKWLRWDGEEMTIDDWHNAWTKCFGMWMDGEHFLEQDEHGYSLRDDTMLLLFNAVETDIPFRLPANTDGQPWELVLDTRYSRLLDPRMQHAPSSIYLLEGRSIALFRQIQSNLQSDAFAG